MFKDYDRYEVYRNEDGSIDPMPFIDLPKNASDKYIEWDQFSRFDKLANDYYGNPFYDFLILNANPSYLSEWDIPEGSVIRIPFPVEKAKSDYVEGLKRIKKLNT